MGQRRSVRDLARRERLFVVAVGKESMLITRRMRLRPAGTGSKVQGKSHVQMPGGIELHAAGLGVGEVDVGASQFHVYISMMSWGSRRCSTSVDECATKVFNISAV